MDLLLPGARSEEVEEGGGGGRKDTISGLWSGVAHACGSLNGVVGTTTIPRRSSTKRISSSAESSRQKEPASNGRYGRGEGGGKRIEG